ncbi:MAG TPA: nicotinate phosphoribosyltransferase [Candidatus Acidoferrales bacterium]|nr:nicotinate phosphoribosyltransferase [Candidatus Acidoferrales bacterium]
MSDRPVPALFSDLYQLTMMQAYAAEGMTAPAVFELFVRRLPAERNFLVACGLADVLDYLENLQFTATEIDYLRSLGRFAPDFLESLREFRFTGTVHAMPEGTVCFANEPILAVEAPLPQAQFVETAVLNLIHYQTLVASKGVRAVLAAGDRQVVDFGARRTHGRDAALACARALSIAGYAGTSNLEAGFHLGIPVVGTVAHSYIQAHADEERAFRHFAERYPGTTLLVDTYDTLHGVQRIIELSGQLGEQFQVGGIRLDSGDLAALARQSRAMLDAAGLTSVRIVASGNLDEYRVAELRAAHAPIDSFGVGTSVNVVADGPYLEAAYKLVSYDGHDCGKLSPGKVSLPGPKQVYRIAEGAMYIGDIIASRDETPLGEPLLRCVMHSGRRLPDVTPGLAAARARLQADLGALPAALKQLPVAAQSYPVAVSQHLLAAQARLQHLHGGGG